MESGNFGGGFAESQSLADGLRGELVFDQVHDDLGQVGLDEGVADGSDGGAKDVAELADGLDGGVQGRLAGDDLVDLGDDDDAEVTAESLSQGIVVGLAGGGDLLVGLDSGRAAGDQDEGQEQHALHGEDGDKLKFTIKVLFNWINTFRCNYT